MGRIATALIAVAVQLWWLCYHATDRLLVAVALANVAAFLLECGVGPCPDNPVG